MFFPWLFSNRPRFFVFLFLLSFFLRISSFRTTFLDIDESQFSGFAHVLMDGGLPYRDSLDTKPPLIYLFYLLCFFISGKYNMAGVHLAGIFISFFVSLTLYKIAKENKDEKSAFFSALFYAVFSTTYLPKFTAVSINAVMVLPLSLSVLFWLRGERHLRLKDDFFSGFFAAIAFLFKYQGGIVLPLFLGALVIGFLRKKEEIQSSLIRCSTFLGGFLIPVLLTIVLLFFMGVLGDFMTWSLSGSLHYIHAGHETIPFFTNLLLRGGSFILSSLLLWILSLQFIKSEKKDYAFLLITAWLLLSLIPVSLGGRFYGHYFIQLLPPLCLLAGFRSSSLTQAETLKKLLLGMTAPAIFFFLLRYDLNTVEYFFPDDQLFLQKKVGEWMEKNSQPKETLFVWGTASAIYFHSQRKPASRFLWTDWLTGKVPGSDKSNQPDFDTTNYVNPDAWKAFWEDFEKRAPDYFIDTSPADVHHYGKYPVFSYSKLYTALQNYYQFLKNVEGCAIYKRRR